MGPQLPGICNEPAKVGIMPGFIFEPGVVGIVSKSSTLGLEAVDQCTKAGLGQTGHRHRDHHRHHHPRGGQVAHGGRRDQRHRDDRGNRRRPRVQAARWIQASKDQACRGLHRGVTAPRGRTMGHAGAIVSGEDESAEASASCASAASTWWTALRTSAPDGRGPRQVTPTSAPFKSQAMCLAFLMGVVFIWNMLNPQINTTKYDFETRAQTVSTRGRLQNARLDLCP